MKEENKNKGVASGDNNSSQAGKKPSWLVSLGNFFSVPDDNIKKSREKILKEIKGERGDLSFSGNQKIQQANEKIKSKSFLSSLINEGEPDDSAALESEVDRLAEKSVKKETAPAVKSANISFRAHSDNIGADKVIADEKKITNNEKNQIVDTFLKHDDEQYYNKVDIGKEKKSTWRLFSRFAGSQNDQPVAVSVPVAPKVAALKIEDSALKTIKPTLPEIPKSKATAPVVGDKKADGAGKSVIKMSENKEHIYIDVPVKGFWRLFSWFKRGKADNSSDLLQKSGLAKQKPAEDKPATVRAEERIPGHLFSADPVVKYDESPKVDSKKVSESVPMPKPKDDIMHIDSPDFKLEIGEIDTSVKNKVPKPSVNKDSGRKKIDLWVNPEILKSNLIKEDVAVFFDWRKNMMVLICLLIVVIISIAGIRFTFQYELNQKKADLAEWNRQGLRYGGDVKNMEKEMGDILKFKKRISLAAKLLDQHIYWTNFFKFLEENTIDDVYYSGLIGDNGGKYVLPFTARRYNDVPNLIAVMKESDKVIDVKADTAALGKTGVSSELKIEVRPDIFYKKNEQQ